MRQPQTQAETGAALLKRVEHFLACDQPIGFVLVLIRAPADQLVRQQARVAFDGHTRRVACVHLWQRHASVDQPHHAFVVHESDRHVARLQGAGGIQALQRGVGAPVQQALARRLRVAPGIDEGAPLHSCGATRMHVVNDFFAAAAERMCFDERTRQAERKVESPEPRAGCGEPRGKRIERGKGFEPGQLQHRPAEVAERHGDRFLLAGVAAEVDAGQQRRCR